MTQFNQRSKVAAAILLALSSVPAFAADEEEKPTPPPGLPPGVDWTFNFNATFGAFGFGNSLYLDPKPGEPAGDLGDNWTEGTVKGALGGVYTLANKSEFYGKASAVGERTWSTAPDLVGGDASSFGVEDLYIGWRSGEDGKLDFSVGREQYKLGHGMLLYDGASEGGSRGGYWTNARKAFEFAAIGRYKSGSSTIEVFYLDRDELPESDSGSKLAGVNYEYAIGEDTTLGATYMKWSAKENMRPERDGLDVYNLRAYTAPFASLKALSFELEYALEDNGLLLDSTAWNAAASYQFEGAWAPKLTYRYAFFEGDDPDTAA